jgi:hypothetical protein
MSIPSISQPYLLERRSTLELSAISIRIIFWTAGILLASAQGWLLRFKVSADSISYLDMSDGVLPGGNWHQLINGTWSPLYPLLIGLARRIFPISATNEIAVAHLLSIGFFIFAFACFEFFLQNATSRFRAVPKDPGYRGVVPIPQEWACLSLAYSVFLWASISAISLRFVRPDMLMSGFLYLSAGILLRMQSSPACIGRYAVLGLVLGLGYLAKAPMLPIGILILALTLFAVEHWRPAVKMVAAALALIVAIGSLYFVPLSQARGHFTLGKSSAFNYVVHVDLARPVWYLQDPGLARGSFTNPPEKIFSSPRAYAFALPCSCTHPLRFDPSVWIDGVYPRFILSRQIHVVLANIWHNPEVLLALATATGVLLMVGYFLRRRRDISTFRNSWPICFIGIAGCLMYALVHVEPRYVAPFLVLFWCGMIFSLRVPKSLTATVVTATTLVVIASLLLPMSWAIYRMYKEGQGKVNTNALAAAELERLGVRPGDHVARIQGLYMGDAGVLRIARVTLDAEVDNEDTDVFWSSTVTTQHDLLQTFARRGVTAVIAASPKLNASNQSEWTRLGSTQYWIWRPGMQSKD